MCTERVSHQNGCVHASHKEITREEGRQMENTFYEITQIYLIQTAENLHEFVAESVLAVLTCLRLDVCEKDFEQMEHI